MGFSTSIRLDTLKRKNSSKELNAFEESLLKKIIKVQPQLFS
jgi:hypothetical protein